MELTSSADSPRAAGSALLLVRDYFRYPFLLYGKNVRRASTCFLAQQQMTQEVRTYYADSVHAIRKGGLMQIPLVEGIEVPAEGLCAYIDDVTLAGQLSSVNAHNQRLYVVETSPVSFDFAGTVDAVGDDPNVITQINLQNVPSGLAAGSPFAQYQ